MATKQQMLLLAQISHALPLGYRFQDTGAPRGERNFFSVMKGDEQVFGSFSLSKVRDFVLALTAK